MEELKKKILKDIDKSGFLSEMRTNSVLLKYNWTVIENAGSFHDKDSNLSREIDIIAYRVKSDANDKLQVGIHLIIEVKKSIKPWIVFCQQKKSKYDYGIGWGLLNFKDNMTIKQLSFDTINIKNRHANFEKVGTSYSEAFKKTNESSQIYSALMSCCKAAVFVKENNSWKIEDTQKYDPKNKHYVDFFLPIVIIDGLMFHSVLDEKGEPDLYESDYSPILLNYSSLNYEESTFYPEIITLKGLEEHLNLIEEWHESMYKSILNKIK
jgi:hypothetical protein